jgi:hypothetical protein
MDDDIKPYTEFRICKACQKPSTLFVGMGRVAKNNGSIGGEKAGQRMSGGLANISLDDGDVYCSRNTRDGSSECQTTPFIRIDLSQCLLYFNGTFIGICTRPSCGAIAQFDTTHCYSDERGMWCRCCREAQLWSVA